MVGLLRRRPCVAHPLLRSPDWIETQRLAPLDQRGPSEPFSRANSRSWPSCSLSPGGSKNSKKSSGRFFKGLVFPMAIVCIILLPISRQEDLGYTALIGAVALCVMFVAGMKLRWIAPIVIVGIAGILYLATHIGERRGRLLALSQSGGIPGQRRLPATAGPDCDWLRGGRRPWPW